jgi:hypothetical protein
MKSAPKNTPETPSTWKRRLASGEALALSAAGKSAVPLFMTGTPGMNFKVAGFGVSCVCMNMMLISSA